MSDTKTAGCVDKGLNRLIWIDLEMTGLDPEENVIIEIATIVTDADLEVVAQGPVIAIAQPEAELVKMDKWNTRQHNSSGLVERVRNSKISAADAEMRTLTFLREHLVSGQSPMCGNSIGQDRRFMVKYMPKLEQFFHYRNVDVSTLKELARRWRPELMDKFVKQNTHLALDDIKESINELSFYREHLIKS